MQARLIVHGGAGIWKDALDAPKRASILKSLKIGWEILSSGGSALDVVEKAVNWLEDDPLFDAGTGSHLNEEGQVEMDALIIDGTKHNFGAVGAVKRVRYPISLARKVLEETQQNFFVGEGADKLAERLGMPLVPNISLVSESELSHFYEKIIATVSDTVGAIAIDTNGRIAVATSTGGTRFKPAGRVGDSPIFGAGGYADEIGGASATGWGENALRTLLSKHVVDEIRNGKTAQEAADTSMNYVEGIIENSMLGTIVIDMNGNYGAAHTTEKLAYGWVDANGNPHAAMKGGMILKETS